jgi:hypothetical protein
MGSRRPTYSQASAFVSCAVRIMMKYSNILTLLQPILFLFLAIGCHFPRKKLRVYDGFADDDEVYVVDRLLAGSEHDLCLFEALLARCP